MHIRVFARLEQFSIERMESSDSPQRRRGRREYAESSLIFKPLRYLCALCVCGGEFLLSIHSIENRSSNERKDKDAFPFFPRHSTGQL
jgi:hypothetical protein